jgi:hypothetical protein
VPAANVLSTCGTTMTFLAIPWFVLATTGAVLGVTAAFLLVDGLYLLVTLCPVVLPVWREMDAL